MAGFLLIQLKPFCFAFSPKIVVCRCRSQLPMNTILLNTMLSACEKGSQWSLALHFFSTWSHLADETSWARLAAACGSLQWMAMLMWVEAARGDVVAEIPWGAMRWQVFKPGAEEKNV